MKNWIALLVVVFVLGGCAELKKLGGATGVSDEKLMIDTDNDGVPDKEVTEAEVDKMVTDKALEIAKAEKRVPTTKEVLAALNPIYRTYGPGPTAQSGVESIGGIWGVLAGMALTLAGGYVRRYAKEQIKVWKEGKFDKDGKPKPSA